jgi:hypothetical protein
VRTAVLLQHLAALILRWELVHLAQQQQDATANPHKRGRRKVVKLSPEEMGGQAAERIGCGREDSNLHGCYPTRSLADLAEEKAHEFKGASRSGTPENTLGRSDFSPVVKNLARDLLRAVADGGDVPIAQVHDLARAVIEAPSFQVARQILQGGSPEFAVRKALELAWMVLTTDDDVAENPAAETGVVALCAGKKTMRRSD